MSTPDPQYVRQPPLEADFGSLGHVCRLGLATRGNTRLEAADVLAAVDHGINYLNWCGYADGLSQAVRQLGARRREVIVAAQFNARTAPAAQRELAEILGELGTDYVDVLTYYYVEHREEWAEIVAPGGAAKVLEAAKRENTVRSIGLTSHQRCLAAEWAASGRLDMLMIRYNAAHRGAERDVFPVTMPLKLPVVTYTGLRWGALPNSTPEDPQDFVPPGAPEWYRFVLCHPGVTVGIMAPDGRAELEQDLALLDDWHGLEFERYQALCEHGDRVRLHAGSFP